MCQLFTAVYVENLWIGHTCFRLHTRFVVDFSHTKEYDDDIKAAVDIAARAEAEKRGLRIAFSANNYNLLPDTDVSLSTNGYTIGRQNHVLFLRLPSYLHKIQLKSSHFS